MYYEIISTLDVVPYNLSYDGNLMSVLTVPPKARQLDTVAELAADPRPVLTRPTN